MSKESAPQDQDIFDDFGIVAPLVGLPRMPANFLGEQLPSFLSKRELVALEVIRHPVRDSLVASVALGGLGLALGAAVFKRHP